MVALPDEGRPMMEGWFMHHDKDVRWIMKQNLAKKRLTKMDAEWVKKWQEELQV